MLLLTISPPPLSRSAPFCPSVRTNASAHIKQRHQQRRKKLEILECEIITCCWLGQWKEHQTAAEERSLVHNGPDRSSCPAGVGGGQCGQSWPLSSLWLSLIMEGKKSEMRSENVDDTGTFKVSREKNSDSY